MSAAPFDLAHSTEIPRLTWEAVFTQWSLDPIVVALLVGIVALYRLGLGRVPGFPRRRAISFFAGAGVVAFATLSPVATYSEAMFSAHMVQHLLLTLVAAPLLVLGAPLALALRAASPRARLRLASVARSGIVRWATHPIVDWSAFGAVMWASHLSSLYEASLHNPLVHGLEHGLYVTASLLFWWPVIGLDPGTRRMSWPVRLLYVALALPVQSLLGLVLYSSESLLYAHYELAAAPWGPDPADDQTAAGLIMWLGGDLLLIAALALMVGAWMRDEERKARSLDRRAIAP